MQAKPLWQGASHAMWAPEYPTGVWNIRLGYITLGTQMKLLKCTPTKGEDGENNYTNVVEMISDDPSELKSKATDLCRLIGVEPAPWCSRYPIMGDKEVQSNHEWIMELSNGISFAIEK